jgi:basic membrane protein A and related proteins
MNGLSRRRILALGGAIAWAGVERDARAQSRLKVAALFAGRIDDAGFMQAGYQGLIFGRDRLGAEIAWRDGVKPEPEALAAALRLLAGGGADLIIAHGGQNNEAAKAVAPEFPLAAFVVTQGNVTGPNLASYEVLQEESAFLAGALAGLATVTGTVGHISGIRVAPGLKGRAAFANGLAVTNPQATFLTNFCGSQDDEALSMRVATAMIDARADIIFTMLNAGRGGAIEACRQRGIRQIGNVSDWVTKFPEVFIASAVADSGMAVQMAVADFVAGKLGLGAIKKIGLTRPDAVRLVMSPDLPAQQRLQVERLEQRIRAGDLEVSTTWNGREFATPF